MSEKLSRLKRCNVFNNGLVNDPNGKLVLYSEVFDLLRDEQAGANITIHRNVDPDGNEADVYVCITSDKINLCITGNMAADAEERYDNKPWIPKPKPAPKPRRKKKKTSARQQPALPKPIPSAPKLKTNNE